MSHVINMLDAKTSLSKLVQALEVEPLYNPNEKMLTKPTLLAKAKKLSSVNGEVITARVAWSNARIERNKALYGNVESLYTTMTSVKKYVRAIYGHDSEQYAQVKTLSFTKPGKS